MHPFAQLCHCCIAKGFRELNWSPRVAVIAGGYHGPQEFALDSDILSDVSSLHMFGANDYVVSSAKSQQVADVFKKYQVRNDHVHEAKVPKLTCTLGHYPFSKQMHANQVVVSVHNQGHVIPKQGDTVDHFATFLSSEPVNQCVQQQRKAVV